MDIVQKVSFLKVSQDFPVLLVWLTSSPQLAGNESLWHLQVTNPFFPGSVRLMTSNWNKVNKPWDMIYEDTSQHFTSRNSLEDGECLATSKETKWPEDGKHAKLQEYFAVQAEEVEVMSFWFKQFCERCGIHTINILPHSPMYLAGLNSIKFWQSFRTNWWVMSSFLFVFRLRAWSFLCLSRKSGILPTSSFSWTCRQKRQRDNHATHQLEGARRHFVFTFQYHISSAANFR